MFRTRKQPDAGGLKRWVALKRKIKPIYHAHCKNLRITRSRYRAVPKQRTGICISKALGGTLRRLSTTTFYEMIHEQCILLAPFLITRIDI